MPKGLLIISLPLPHATRCTLELDVFFGDVAKILRANEGRRFQDVLKVELFMVSTCLKRKGLIE